MDPAPKRVKSDALVAMGFHAVPNGSKGLRCLAWAVGDGLLWSSFASSCSTRGRREADFLAEFIDRVCHVLGAGGRAACCSPRVLECISKELYHRKLFYLAERWNKLRPELGLTLIVTLGSQSFEYSSEDNLRGCRALLISQHCVRKLAATPTCACSIADQRIEACDKCKACCHHEACSIVL